MLEKQTRRFNFPQTPYCSIPTGVSAYSVTITVIPDGRPLPFMTAWPAGGSQPNVSSVNSFAGRVVANSVIIPAGVGPDYAIDMFAFAATDVIVDINGYFAPDNGTGLYYFPVTQCRIAHSGDLTFSGTSGPPIYQDNTTKTIQMLASSRCPLPTNAKAYALNATVMPNGNPMPFLTVYPTGAAQPNASLINAFEGQTVSSAGIIPAGPDGSINVYAYRQTHVAVEVSGVFARPNTTNQQTVTFQQGVWPSAAYSGAIDSTIHESFPTQNFGSIASAHADGDDGNGADVSALLKWDISSIPTSATVQSAEIRLNVFDPSANTYNLHSLNALWLESQVTWSSSLTGIPWSLGGALSVVDRGSMIGTVTPTSTGEVIVTLNAAGIAAVQQWVTSPATNNGVIISNPAATDGFDFSSREAGTASQRPQLRVSYAP